MTISECDRLVLFSDGVSDAREDEDDRWVVEVSAGVEQSGVESPGGVTDDGGFGERGRRDG